MTASRVGTCRDTWQGAGNPDTVLTFFLLYESKDSIIYLSPVADNFALGLLTSFDLGHRSCQYGFDHVSNPMHGLGRLRRRCLQLVKNV